MVDVAMLRIVYLELRVLFLEAEGLWYFGDRQADDLQRIAEFDAMPSAEI